MELEILISNNVHARNHKERWSSRRFTNNARTLLYNYFRNGAVLSENINSLESVGGLHHVSRCMSALCTVCKYTARHSMKYQCALRRVAACDSFGKKKIKEHKVRKYFYLLDNFFTYQCKRETIQHTIHRTSKMRRKLNVQGNFGKIWFFGKIMFKNVQLNLENND